MIEEIKKIAHDAGQEIMKIYQSENIEFTYKSDLSPITKADSVSNTLILNRLNDISNIPIMSEESEISYKTRKDKPLLWIVDPLDGTKDFVNKNNEFTINIALVQKNIPVLGVVYAPALNLMYSGVKSKGAFLNDKLIYNNSKRKNLIAAISRFHSSKETELFLRNHNIKHTLKFGSSLKMCKLAEGAIDIYPRLNGTKEWDTAASDIICREAGCKLIDYKTKKNIKYNKENIKNNYFIGSRVDLNFV